MTDTYRLPRDVKQECLWIVRGYERRKKAYREAREDILGAGGGHYTTYLAEDGEACRFYAPGGGGGESRPVEAVQARLDKLESAPDTKRMRAVEYALAGAGVDLPVGMRRQLQKALMLNCCERNNYPYRELDIPGIEKKDFYRRKTEFLTDIAAHLEMF